LDFGAHETLEIVGVVRTGKYRNLNENPKPFMYWSLFRSYSPQATLVVQTTGSPAPMLAAVQREIHDIGPDVPMVEAETLDQYMSVPLFTARVSASLFGTFGLLALGLATSGLYGGIAYSVSQRTNEIGIRLALGAQRRDILWHIVGEGAKLTLIGVAIGLAASLALGRLLANQLYGVSAADPITFAGVAILLIFVALVGCYIPARRAMGVDPAVALRHE
jgi:putative ABC transport system permease protein